MQIERETVSQDPQTGSTQAVHTKETVLSPGVQGERQAGRANAYIWYVVGVLNVLVAMRFIFLLLGAKNTGFVSYLYQVTSPLISMFKGIFASPGSDTGYFDSASLLAIAFYSLVGWGIVSLITISNREKV